MITTRPQHEIVLVTKQPFLFTTIYRLNVDYMSRMFFEILFEGAEFELNCRIREVQQTIRHIDVIKSSGKSHNGRIVTKIYGYTLWMGRWGSSCWVSGVRSLTTIANIWMIGIVFRMIRSNSERSAMNKTQFVVR